MRATTGIDYKGLVSFMWVAIGGAAGSCLRYALALLFGALSFAELFPLGTFAANVLGSFGLGVVFVLGEDVNWFGTDARLFFGTGVMGGFTTYSAFNLESLGLVETGLWGRAVLYMTSTVVVCFVAGVLGLWVGRALRGN
ncbi:MAG: fluoride efflux transporter CrcB [Myxococcota bacterium]